MLVVVYILQGLYGFRRLLKAEEDDLPTLVQATKYTSRIFAVRRSLWQLLQSLFPLLH